MRSTLRRSLFLFVRRSRRTLVACFAAALLCLLSSAHTVQAQQLFTATLSGAQEVPARTTPATGEGTVLLSADETTIKVNLTYRNLTTTVRDMHLHAPASRGMNAPVRFGFTNRPTAQSGTIPEQTFTVTPTDVANLRAGLFYFNVHTQMFTGGEIRGQVEPACVEPPAGMVAWYPGNGDARDIVGGNDATPQNGATFAAGRVGQAFSLDGVDDHLTVPTTAINFGSGNFTVDMWFNLDNVSGDQTLFNKVVGDFPNSQEYAIEANSGSLRFLVRDTTANENDLVLAASLQANTWYHIAAVRQGDTNLLYLNGVLLGQQTAGTNADTGTGGTATIGRLGSTPARFVDGRIDELELFERALAASEIKSIHDAGITGKCRAVDLAVTLADAPDPAIVGDTVTFTATATNASTLLIPATSAKLVVTLRAGMNVVANSITLTGTNFTLDAADACSAASNVITCSLRQIPRTADLSGQVQLTFDAVAMQPGKVETAVATISAAETDSDLTDNARSVVTTVFGLQGFTLSPAVVTGGCGSLTGTLTLSSAAPAEGLEVLLTNTNAGITAPSSVSFAAGERTKTFTATTAATATQQIGAITAALGTSSISRQTIVRPPVLNFFALSSGTVTGGGSVTGTLRLNCAAPAGGITVSVSSSSAAAQVPASVTFNAGETEKTFTVTTSMVTTRQQAFITATNGATSIRRGLRIQPGQ